MRLPRLLKSTRFWGILGVAGLGYLLVFGVLGRVDVGWMLPTHRIAATLREAWPDMPFFTQLERRTDGREVLYTVPTRQLTPAEVAQLTGTNATSEAPTK